MVGGIPGGTQETITPSGFAVGSTLLPGGTMVSAVTVAARLVGTVVALVEAWSDAAAVALLVAAGSVVVAAGPVVVAAGAVVTAARCVGRVVVGRVEAVGVTPPTATSARVPDEPTLSIADREAPNASGAPTTTSRDVSAGVRARLASTSKLLWSLASDLSAALEVGAFAGARTPSAPTTSTRRSLTPVGTCRRVWPTCLKTQNVARHSAETVVVAWEGAVVVAAGANDVVVAGVVGVAASTEGCHPTKIETTVSAPAATLATEVRRGEGRSMVLMVAFRHENTVTLALQRDDDGPRSPPSRGVKIIGFRLAGK